MSVNKGLLYEKHIHKTLKDDKLVPSGFSPAGFSVKKPDCKFSVGGKTYGLEVKLDIKADFGQGTLVYDFNKLEWLVSSENPKMDDLLNHFKINEYANSEWTKVPNRVGKHDIGRRARPTSKLTSTEKDEDKKNFPSKTKVIRGSNPIAEYYNSKNVYYIQIGGFKSGFYYMGSDPANLGVPEFKPSQTKIRIRHKGDRFTTALLLETTALKTSDYDIDVSTNFILNAGR